MSVFTSRNPLIEELVYHQPVEPEYIWRSRRFVYISSFRKCYHAMSKFMTHFLLVSNLIYMSDE